MSSEMFTEFERRLSRLEDQLSAKSAELDRARSQLHSLRQQPKRPRRRHGGPLVGLLLVTALVSGFALAPHSPAQPKQPAAVTVVQAPYVVNDSAGKAIFEVSEHPRGLKVFSTTGEALYLGTEKGGPGLIQLLGLDGKLILDLSSDGFKFFGKSQASVAFVGADSANNGALQLKNNADGVVVDIGVLGAATGYVQVYPKSGKTPFPIPNYLKGGK